MNENEELFKLEEQKEKNFNIPKNKSFTQRANFKSYKKSKIKGSYYLGKTLGQGTFGKVKLAIHIITGEKIAIKIINKEKLVNIESNIQNVKKEISILKKLIHKNIIQLYEVMESKNNLYIVMEYCENKELFDYIVKKGKLSEEESCIIFQQIINGVHYLHQQGICHRDLKPENILLDAKNNVKITDFGLSTFLSKNILLSTPCGTPTYAPPEMLKGEKYNGELSDVWSCGIILFALLNGNVPFEESQEIFVYKKIIQSGLSGLKFSKEISENAKDLIYKMLKIEPKERININDIIKHKWFNLVENSMIPGIDLKSKQNYPIDENILKEVGKYGYNIEECRLHLNMNKYDSLTTIYRLLMRKYIMKGGKSIGDLNSQTYLNYVKSKNILFKEKSKNFELDNKFEINKRKKKIKKKDIFFQEYQDKNQKNIVQNKSDLLFICHYKKKSMDINFMKSKLNSINNNFNKNNICKTEESNLKNYGKDNNEIKINFKQIKNCNSKTNSNNQRTKLIMSEKSTLIKKKKLSPKIYENQFEIAKSFNEYIIKCEDDDLTFENELKKLDFNCSNVRIIKIMAQKLLNCSFNSSNKLNLNKYIEQKKKNIYFTDYQYNEKKSVILGEKYLQNYNILKIGTNKIKPEQRYTSNKQLIKKKNLFLKKQCSQSKKKNSFFDISTTQFDSSLESSSSFNKNNILSNSSKRMNKSYISIPFFSLNFKIIDYNVINKNKTIGLDKKININNDKQNETRKEHLINETDSTYKHQMETTLNKYSIKNIENTQIINIQKNNKSYYSSNNNKNKSIIGLFKSRIPLINNDNHHTHFPSPITLNKKLNVYFKYNNKKKQLNYEDNKGKF